MQIRDNVPLAPLTTLRLGGPARHFTTVPDEDGLREALAWAGTRGLPVLLLAGGSNLIIPDRGWPGLVVQVSLGGLEFSARGGSLEVRAGAGVEWDRLVREAVARGAGGIECLSGIPGSVGATPIQNVGAYGQDVAAVISGVTCLDRAGMTRVGFAPGECGFGYRTSRFKAGDRNRYVVLEVRFTLQTGAAPVLAYPELREAVRRIAGFENLPPAQALVAVRGAVLALRRSKSMVLDEADPNTRSVGSFFVNPVLPREAFRELELAWKAEGDGKPVPSFPAEGGVKVPAAWLVERAGFPRGYQKGGVGISSRHTLALVNYGGTTAELLALAAAVEQSVRERFGVTLEREPVVATP